MYKTDTICAIATPHGEGAISIIRLSGDRAFEIIEKLFRKKTKEDAKKLYFSKTQIGLLKAFSLNYGAVFDSSGEIIDEVLLSIFKTPHSYTGEDLIEINLHGGRIVTKKVLDELLKLGAKLAEPGEFTKRAFLNGKLDLSQVEATADIIFAKSEIALKCSQKQLSGVLGEQIREIQKKLLDVCSLIELELDFIEDDIEFVKRDKLLNVVMDVKNEITKMVQSYNIGRLFKDGVKVAIIGKPNVGKSTILNSLLCFERAIVSEIPGTTRDFVEEVIQLDGILFRIIDTAGLRKSNDQIELAGIKKTFEQMDTSDIILYVFDFSQEYDSSDWENFHKMISRSNENNPYSRIIILYNKTDLVNRNFIQNIISKNNVDFELKRFRQEFISKNDPDSINILKEVLVNSIKDSGINYNDTAIITNFRHRESLRLANEKLSNSCLSIQNGESPEFISIHLRGALNHIGEIIGSVTTEDILNNIFSRFCIGK